MSINFFGNNSLDKLISLIKSKFDKAAYISGSTSAPEVTEVRDADTLKGHQASEFIRKGTNPIESPLPIIPKDADTLGGHDADYFAKAGDLIDKIKKTDIVNNLTSTTIDAPLSAAQGKILNDVMNVNSLNNPISITSYTMDNKYICPCDGYIRGYMQKATSGYAQVRAESANGNDNYIEFTMIPNANAGMFETMYVKKGMKVYVVYSDGSYSVSFMPLI